MVNIFNIINIFFIWVVLFILCDNSNVVKIIIIVVMILMILLLFLNGLDNDLGKEMFNGVIRFFKLVEKFEVMKVIVIKYFVKSV